jgi:hypothetical protein
MKVKRIVANLGSGEQRNVYGNLPLTVPLIPKPLFRKVLHAVRAANLPKAGD